MPSKLDEAVRKARSGYAVFPLAANQKIPLIAGGRGCLDATCDESIVAAWWERTPEANIGILCGPRPEGSGVWVLDVDGEEGRRNLEVLTERFGPLPETLVVDTPSGGKHYYFAFPTGKVIKNAVKLAVDGTRIPKLDVRSSRGYVVAPGSVVNGKPYRVTSRVPPADAPDWLLALVVHTEPERAPWVPQVVGGAEVSGDALHRRRVAWCRASLETACARIATLAEGGRNDAVNNTLKAFGSYAAAGYLDAVDARGRIEAAAIACGLPPREVAQLLRPGGGWDVGFAKPRHPDLEDRPRQATGGAPRPDVWAVEDVAPTETRAAVVDMAGVDLDPDEVNRRLAETVEEPEVPPLDVPILLTDLGNARRLVRRERARLRYVADVGGWAAWDGTRWVLDVRGRAAQAATFVTEEILDEAREMQRHADAIAKAPLADGVDGEARAEHVKQLRADAAARFAWGVKSQSANHLGAMVRVAQSDPEVVSERADYDRQPELLNLLNGVVNLRTGELRAHDPGLLLMHRAHAEHYPDRAYECPKWWAFLRTVFRGDEEMVSYIQRAAGMSMVGHGPKDALFVLYGMGANGKSTLVSVLTDILGSYAVNTRVQTFMTKGAGNAIPADVAALAGARMVTMAEPTAGDQLATGLIKECLGEAKMTARFLNQNFFSFTPTFAPWLSCNHKPIVKDTSDGTWRRMQVVGFGHKFEEHEQVKNYDKVLLAEERDAIFAWMLAGARAYLAVGLQPPQRVRDDVATYRQEMDLLAEFCDEYLERGEHFTAAYEDVWQAFRGWTRDNNDEKAWSKKRFTREMGDRGLRRDVRKDNGQPFVGVRLVRRAAEPSGPPPMWHERD